MSEYNENILEDTIHNLRMLGEYYASRVLQQALNKIKALEQQVKTLKHDGEVLNKHAMKLEEQLEEQLEEYKKRLCE